MDEKGYIKFDCKWKKAEPFPDSAIAGVNEWRNRLYGLGLIGVYPDGIGFGNISTRIGNSSQFIVSGSATGMIKKTNSSHYAKVVGCDFARNWLACEGPVEVSSESMTHAAIYLVDAAVNAVIHVHNNALWKKLMGNVPTTDKKVEYGTPEMAAEMMRLIKVPGTKEKKIIVMAGHEEGVITFGRTIDEAGQALLDYFRQL